MELLEQLEELLITHQFNSAQDLIEKFDPSTPLHILLSLRLKLAHSEIDHTWPQRIMIRKEILTHLSEMKLASSNDIENLYYNFLLSETINQYTKKKEFQETKDEDSTSFLGIMDHINRIARIGIRLPYKDIETQIQKIKSPYLKAKALFHYLSDESITEMQHVENAWNIIIKGNQESKLKIMIGESLLMQKLFKGDILSAKELGEDLIKTASNIGHISNIGQLNGLLSMISNMMQNKELSDMYTSQEIDFYLKDENYDNYCSNLNKLAFSEHRQRKYDKAKETISKVIELGEKFDRNYSIKNNFNSLASAYEYLGNYELARKYHEKRVTSLEGHFTQPIAISELCNFYVVIGELDKAENLAMQMNASKMDLEYTVDNIDTMMAFSLSEIYRRKGHLNKAIQILEENSPQNIVFNQERLLNSLVELAFEMKNIDLSIKYFDQYARFLADQDQIFQDRHKIILEVLQAKILFAQKTMNTTIKAREIVGRMDIDDLVSKGRETNEIKLLLVELFLEELKMYPSEELFLKVNETIDDLIIQNEFGFNRIIQLQSMILKSKMLVIEQKMPKALEILEEAKEHAIGMKLKNIEKEIEIEIDRVKSMVAKWKQVLDVSTHITQMIQETKINDYIKIAKSMTGR
ncbi:MAG: tetratricopeptide repeat protein [Candidatus Heimdallarchaeota archaeon]|nr:tetratricopeptide repeat protein [Candidatus Heimdallarchaeota archaeon]